MSLMCFHASRFEARTDQTGAIILYDDQDTNLWDQELIKKGAYFLDRAYAKGNLTKYHLEAQIAFHHTQIVETGHKWVAILQLYNEKALKHFQKALMLANSAADKVAITKNIGKLTGIIAHI
ncbi:hypothetical protein HQN84_22395 [Pedobacter steynii]|nr:hypothetical protein [Pedobacter steynii]